ncbi:ASKHA domain-containing protein [Luminiphilus sp.]|nr:ASKHA domain-containing protein [Luminiphilus sp.]
MSDTSVKILFMPSGRRGSFPKGTPVLDAARSLGVDIDSVCGGRGLCGRCRVECMSGHFPKHGLTSDTEHLSPFSATEARFEERKGPLPERHRLSCHATLIDDVVIDVPPESQVHRQIIRKDTEHRDIRLNTATRLHYVEVEAASLEDIRGEAQLLLDALKRDWELENLRIEANVLPRLQKALIEGKQAVTVAVYNACDVIAIWPGLFESPRGIAIDVGSTTVAAHLCDLGNGEVLGTASVMNPQIRFGEDLMSRVSYIMMHPEGAGEMTTVIRRALNELFVELSEGDDCALEDILEITLVANPIMHHILLGIDPVNLGGAPFALTTTDALELRAKDLDLNIHPGGRVYVLPCIAGHVGADSAGVILAEHPEQDAEMTLVIDVGTNAEIVLGNKDRMLVCSTPTGPAFEGAQISSGQRATFGAIERVRVDRETLEPRFKIIGSDLWSDEPGFEQALGSIGVTGICGSGIIEAVAEMFLAGIVSEDGVINGALAEQSSRIFSSGRTWSFTLHTASADGQSDISVTQNDIRQIQLAKAALYAGVKLLQDHMGTQHIDRIRLAGAFGSHISLSHAMVLGLIPDCPLKNVSAAGNAAGMGARIALLDRDSRGHIEKIVRWAERIETAVEDKFQDYFVDAMAFPHKSDPFTHLFAEILPPVVRTQQAEAGNSRRRRGRTRS